MLFVFDESAVSGDVERAARNSEFVAFNGLPARRASRPCFIVRGRLAVRRRMIAEPEAVDKDVLRCIARMVVCVETVFEIADDLLLRAIGGVVAEADARTVVHRCEEPRIVGARREGEAAGVDFDARPVQAGRCAAACGEQGVSNGRRAVEVELGLAEVLNAAHRDVLCVDVERVVRHDVACRAARCTAVEEGVVQRGRIEAAVALAKVDGVARRLARAVRVAAVDFIAAAKRAALDVDRIARSVARRHIIRRRECGIRRDVAAIELAAHIERAAPDVDGIVLRIGVLRGVYSCRIIFIRRMKKQIPTFGIACIAHRYRSAVKEIERIEIRAAIQCLRIAGTRRGESKRRRTILFEVQRIVVRRIAIDRDARMDVGAAARRRRFRGILEAIAVEN